MQGPLQSVAVLENVCPPDEWMPDYMTHFVNELLVLNKKDEMLACVLDECDILPSCMDYCFGWCNEPDSNSGGSDLDHMFDMFE